MTIYGVGAWERVGVARCETSAGSLTFFTRLGVNMKIWLAHLSGQQRSSQISSKEVERIGAHVRVLRTRSVFRLSFQLSLSL